MRNTICTVFIVCSLTPQLWAQTRGAAPQTPQPPAATATVASLTAQIANLEKQVDELKSTMTILEYMISAKAVSKREVSFDTGKTGTYQRIDTDAGSFLISLDTVAEYLDGYKATFQITPMSPITYRGFVLTAVTSRRFEPKMSFADYKATQKTKEQTFSQSLLPGRWNSVEVLLPGVKATDIGEINIEMSVSTVTPGN